MKLFYILELNGTQQRFETIELLNEYKAKYPEWEKAVYSTEQIDGVINTSAVPQSVPLWCLRTALRAMGLLQTVIATIQAMPNGVQKIAAEEGIEYANTVLRNSHTTLFIQSVLQLTDEQVDDIFINANAVEA